MVLRGPSPPRVRLAQTTMAIRRPYAAPDDDAPTPMGAAQHASRTGVLAMRRGLGRFVWRLFAVSFVVSAALVSFVLIGAARDLPDPLQALAAPSAPTITVLDRRGQMVARRGAGAVDETPLSAVPQTLIDAILTVEDQRFYSHSGLDAEGAARALAANIAAGRVVQGGSTITQQLARNLFLTHERTWKRKAQEALLALWLERRFTKDQILELYLNRVYFGAGAWGVQAASLRYFGKAPADLTLGESALLAGLLKAPSRFSPALAPRRAEDRATLVVDVMVREGVITDAQRIAAFAEPVVIKRSSDAALAGHFVDWVAERVGDTPGVFGTELIIDTTLDLRMQAAADRAVATVMDEHAAARGATQAALVAMDGDGAVRALVGGVDYRASQYNRAVQARRQPGSAFKTFIYAAALERGLYPSDVRRDDPIEVDGWAPRNYRDQYRGEVTLMTAFSRSINTVAVRVSEEIGRQNVVATARRLGVRSSLPATPAMALGAYEMSLLELTGAYAPFANGGHRVNPYVIAAVRAPDGTLLYERPPTPAAPVLNDGVRQAMTAMLHDVVVSGTGRGARLSRQAAGKTGTTNDHRDAWFIGFVRSFVAGVWVGDDEFQPMESVTGGGLPARLWATFMREALTAIPARELDMPPPPPAPLVERDTGWTQNR